MELKSIKMSNRRVDNQQELRSSKRTAFKNKKILVLPKRRVKKDDVQSECLSIDENLSVGRTPPLHPDSGKNFFNFSEESLSSHGSVSVPSFLFD